MTNNLNILLAQINTTVGDISGNLAKHLDVINNAKNDNIDLVVFPELSLTGYPPEDLLLREAFIDEAKDALNKLLAESNGIYIAAGYPEKEGGKLYNACAILHEGRILGQHHKHHLPNYGVFDEVRYFTPHDKTTIVDIKGTPVGIVICEDIWYPDPVSSTVKNGAKLIVSPNASPFRITKHEERLKVLRQHKIPIAYVNQVGGQDELIFDGGSMYLNENGEIISFAGFHKENLITNQTNFNNDMIPSHHQRIYDALVLAIRDYIHKNRFPGALVGLSGGIDSALTLTLAVDALGAENVTALVMPSRHTSPISLEEADKIAKNLNVKTHTISIEPTYEAFLTSLKPLFADKPSCIAKENLQARCRALLLMAESNKHGRLVLTTGNRSELATGYCTLYGDMAGGFAPLRDVPKTLVYDLANYRNSVSPVIPQRTIDRPPSAELAPDQKDEDTLPPYPVLDAILEDYLINGLSIDEIAAKGLDRDTVAHIVSLIYKNEYKRRQAAIGPRINNKSFGKDWRYPVTNRFSE